jgi:hypothetical protein
MELFVDSDTVASLWLSDKLMSAKYLQAYAATMTTRSCYNITLSGRYQH